MNKTFWEQRWISLVTSKESSFFGKTGRIILNFFSLIYACAVHARNKAYDKKFFSVQRVSAPVLSIGNLTVGGSGKTTLVMWCAGQMIKAGKKPVIISRGYGRKVSGSGIVSDGKKIYGDARIYGDEPCLMARKLEGVPIVVDADRTRGAGLAVREFKPDCIFLDDGFQHRTLHRGFDIVCMDEWIFSAPFVFPRGFLREKADSLCRAHFVVVKAEDHAEDFFRLFEKTFSFRIDLPHAIFTYKVKEIRDHVTGKILPAEQLEGKELLVLSGIAHPESFENLLKKSGGCVKISRRYSDHYSYTGTDWDRLRDDAERNHLTMVTTEKDAVKMPKDFPVQIIGLQLHWMKGEQELKESLLRAVHE